MILYWDLQRSQYRSLTVYPHPKIVALLLALMVHRQKKARARISEKTLRFVSRRSTIRGSFLSDLRRELEDIGYVLVSLARGGYALIAISALEGRLRCWRATTLLRSFGA